VGVVFADWNAPALGRILDQQGVGNVGNSTTYQWFAIKTVQVKNRVLLFWQEKKLYRTDRVLFSEPRREKQETKI
jgi:hypothetical protein